MKPDAMRDALEAERRRVEVLEKAMEERQEEILHKRERSRQKSEVRPNWHYWFARRTCYLLN